MQRKQQVGECWVYVIFFAWSLTPSSTSPTRDALAPKGGSLLGPPLSIFGALAPKLLSAMWIQGFGGGAPEFFFFGSFLAVLW